MYSPTLLAHCAIVNLAGHVAKIVSQAVQLQRKVEYVPPAAEAIHTYVKNVCTALGEQVDVEFDTPDVRLELANFLTVVASIWSKHLNTTIQSLDNDAT